MKNTILFLLPLFLIFPAATQCMEKEIVVKPKTMQEIRDKRDEIYQDTMGWDLIGGFDEFIFQKNWPKTLRHLQEHKKENDHQYIWDELHLHNVWRNKDYSFFGLIAIAVKNKTAPDSISDTHEIKILKAQAELNRHQKKDILTNPEQVSLKEKKELIQQFIELSRDTATIYEIKITPTTQDKEFALLTKHETFEIEIVKHFFNLKNSSFLLEMQVPQDVVNHISLLMFEAEESLF